MTVDEPLHIPTPTGVTLTLNPAGPLPRACAYIIDLLIRLVLLILLLLAMQFFGRVGQGTLLLLVFSLEWLYPMLFEWLYGGRTPGKALIGLRVIQRNGGTLTIADSILRNLLRVVDALPVGYLLGFIATLCSREHQRLGDWAAGTLVIHDRAPPLPSSIDPHMEQSLMAALGRQPGLDHQVLTELASRMPHLSAARQQDIAQLLFPSSTARQAQQQLAALFPALNPRHSP